MTESSNTSSGPNWLNLDAELVSRETEPQVQVEAGVFDPATAHPVELTPVELTPVELTPVELSPVELSPVELSPVELSPVELGPVELTPVEHDAEPAPEANENPQATGSARSTPTEGSRHDSMSAVPVAVAQRRESFGSHRAPDQEAAVAPRGTTGETSASVPESGVPESGDSESVDPETVDAFSDGSIDVSVVRDMASTPVADHVVSRETAIDELPAAASEPAAANVGPPVPAASVSRETEAEPTDRASRVLVDSLGFDTSRLTSANDQETPIAHETAQAIRVLNVRQQRWPRPDHTRVMTVANQKGGVGKTTSAVNIAAALALHGLRVLLIDLDPQGNASTALGIEHGVGTPSIYDVLLGGESLADVAQTADFAPTLRCVPATLDLAGADIELASQVAREYRLQRALLTFLESAHSEVDYVLIDCPPSLGLLTLNALVAAREVLLPIQCEYYALEGLAQLLKTVDLVTAHLNPHLVVTTVLLTMYDARTRLADQVADEVRRHFGHLVLEPTIPRNVRVSEAPGFGQTVITYDPGSRGAIGYVQAASEIAERGSAGRTQPSRPAGRGEA